MKTNHLLPHAFLALALALPGAAGAQVIPAEQRVRIEMRVQSDQDRKDLAQTTADAVTQHRTLFITLSGKARSPETRTGKWTAFGRRLKENDVVALESGEFKVDLTNGSQKFESKKISTTYTPEHATLGKKGGGGGGGGGGNSGGNRPKITNVPAAGSKFIGFGVVVRDGDKVVGEYFDPAGIKAEAAK